MEHPPNILRCFSLFRLLYICISIYAFGWNEAMFVCLRNHVTSVCSASWYMWPSISPGAREPFISMHGGLEGNTTGFKILQCQECPQIHEEWCVMICLLHGHKMDVFIDKRSRCTSMSMSTWHDSSIAFIWTITYHGQSCHSIYSVGFG